VFQEEYPQKKYGQYLLAQKSTKDGRTIFHWENMKKIKRGDIIFSSSEGKLY